MKRAGAALLIMLWILAGTSAFAAPVCRSTVDMKSYLHQGGLLTHLNKEPVFDIPANFFCDRIVCFGEILFSFLIDESGSVSGVSIAKNTWTSDPEYHASIVTPHINKMRYAPPRLSNKPVCVLAKFNYAMKEVAGK